MPLGIFTRYVPGTVEETARRIKAYGFDTVQLDLEFDDWRFEPEVSTADDCRRVRDVFHRHGLSIAAISGYVNPIAPDPVKRRANIARLAAILRRARDLGSPCVATETGTCHPHDDSAPHSDNATARAFDTLCNVLFEDLIEVASDNHALLLLEPSVGNVIDAPEKVDALFDRLYDSCLGIVADPANFIDGMNIETASDVLRRFYLHPEIMSRVAVAHAKDFRRLVGAPRERHLHASDPALYGGVEYPAAGLGNLEYGVYLSMLARECPVILEHLDESDVPRAKAFMDSKLAEAA